MTLDESVARATTKVIVLRKQKSVINSLGLLCGLLVCSIAADWSVLVNKFVEMQGERSAM